MKKFTRNLAALALVALVGEKALGQMPNAAGISSVPAPALTASPVPYSWPSPTATSPYPTVSLPHGGAPEACAAHEDNNGPLLKGDPLLDWSAWASGCGWFGAVEVDAVGSSIRNGLNAPVTVGGITTTVQLPTANLSWSAMPHVEVGYRLGQAAGEIIFAYRGLSASGSGTLTGFDAAGNSAPLSSHLNMNVFDIDYGSRENSLGPLWDMKWRTGVRIATVFFDSDATTPLLSEHESNNFVGAGVHFGLNLKRRLGETGFSLLGELDGGVVLGHIHQLYEQTVAGVGSGSSSAFANEPAPVLEVRLGVDYAPQAMANLHLSTGYLFQRWWSVGETSGTFGDVTYQGVFCRGEWRY